MTMDITNFRSQMTGDLARPNLFRIEVNLPAGLQNLNSGNRFAEKLSFTARTAQIPSSTMGRIPVHYMGRETYYAGNRTFSDWTITVINDEDWIVRKTFEAWMAALNSHVTNVRRADMSGPNDYVADCYVNQLSKIGDGTDRGIIARYQMIAAFPVELSPIDLAWDSNDVPEEFSVSLSFDAWLSTYQGGTGIQS